MALATLRRDAGREVVHGARATASQLAPRPHRTGVSAALFLVLVLLRIPPLLAWASGKTMGAREIS